MDRAFELSARLKLTLSYAGFLVLAGALLLAAAVARTDPNHDTGELVDRLHTVELPAIAPSAQ